MVKSGSWYIAVATCGLDGGKDDNKWSGGVLDRKVSRSTMGGSSEESYLR